MKPWLTWALLHPKRRAAIWVGQICRCTVSCYCYPSTILFESGHLDLDWLLLVTTLFNNPFFTKCYHYFIKSPGAASVHRMNRDFWRADSNDSIVVCTTECFEIDLNVLHAVQPDNCFVCFVCYRPFTCACLGNCACSPSFFSVQWLCVRSFYRAIF